VMRVYRTHSILLFLPKHLPILLSYSRTNIRRSALSGLTKTSATGCGCVCHCRHENIIRHYNGPHPFQYLRCGRCDRGICTDCHCSEVLTPWPMGMISTPRPAPGREVRYCHVCTNCGLSNRAEMEGVTFDFYGITCSGCSTSSYGDWPRYHIGTVEPYRRDPNASFVKLVMAKAEHAARIQFRYELEALETNMGAELSITNPG
jgi:hypothetical protein